MDLNTIRLFLFVIFTFGAGKISFAEEMTFKTNQWGDTSFDESSQYESVLDDKHYFEPLSAYSDLSGLKKLSSPVGRLDIKMDSGLSQSCTATLIASNQIITAAHCASDSRHYGEIEEMELFMGFYGEASIDETERYKVKMPPHTLNKILDFAILEVAGSPGKKWGVAKYNALIPGPNEALVLIHHPAGLPKHITRGGCISSYPAVVGSTLQHKCATLPGSSGAPIFSYASETIIAIHNKGINTSAPEKNNYATLISGVLDSDSSIEDDLEEFNVGSNNESTTLFSGVLDDTYPTKAILSYIKEDCAKNDEKSCGLLGVVYAEGYGAANKDIPTAIELLDLSCEAKIGMSCLFLGKLYGTGDEVKKNTTYAVEYFRRGCEYGQFEGCAIFGMMLYKGFEIPRNKELGKSYLRKACANSANNACQILNSLD